MGQQLSCWAPTNPQTHPQEVPRCPAAPGDTRDHGLTGGQSHQPTSSPSAPSHREEGETPSGSKAPEVPREPGRACPTRSVPTRRWGLGLGRPIHPLPRKFGSLLRFLRASDVPDYSNAATVKEREKLKGKKSYFPD